MTKFEKPGRKDWDYPDIGRIAAERALKDACIPYEEVQQACVSYCYGDSTCGQRTVYQLGMTGIPVYNVNNNCASGATALFMAKQFVEGGLADCVLAVGFEKMERGSLGAKFTDRTNPLDQHVTHMLELREPSSAPGAPYLFASAAEEHMDRFGTTKEQLAKIAHKNHKHSVNNPYSQFRDEYSLEQILEARPVSGPLTKLQCCPTSDGGAAAVVASEAFVRRHGLEGQAVEIVGMAMATDGASTFKKRSPMAIVGYDMTRQAASRALGQAGLTPSDVQVIELHDCFSANELITYEALGLCGEGGAGALVDAGQTSFGGKYVVNPSGGLISKGHPLGATGLAQCAELCWQLRGEAGARQVAGARVALSHNLGLGGAVVVTVYRRPDEWMATAPKRAQSGAAGFPEDEAGESASATAAAAPAAARPSAGSALKSAALFDAIADGVAADPGLVKKVKGVIVFVVNPDGKWTVDLKNGAGEVYAGDPRSGRADLTLTVADDNLVKLAEGKLNPQQAFMQGKIKIKGNMGLAMKLQSVLAAAKPRSKLWGGGGCAELHCGDAVL